MTDTKQTIRQLPPWSPWRAQTSRPRHPGAVLVAIKVIHTLAWFSIESCMVYLLSAGFAKRSDRRAALAAAVVGGESLIFAANGFRCPLTQLADSLGAERGSVTDIYLPGWFAHNLPAIHAPLLVLAACLHGRNLWQQRIRFALKKHSSVTFSGRSHVGVGIEIVRQARYISREGVPANIVTTS